VSPTPEKGRVKKVHFRPQKPQNTVAQTRAQAGGVLHGAVKRNKGLRVRISQDQPPGHPGPLRGLFEILDAWKNPHTAILEGLLGRATDAAEVLRVIRQGHRPRVSVVNANILTAEQQGAAVPGGAGACPGQAVGGGV
jgi:hypothetical protein